MLSEAYTYIIVIIAAVLIATGCAVLYIERLTTKPKRLRLKFTLLNNTDAVRV